jgi:hypothetical protein
VELHTILSSVQSPAEAISSPKVNVAARTEKTKAQHKKSKMRFDKVFGTRI